MKASIQSILDRNGIMIIDGSMSTALENLGANLGDRLWTARILADEPELIKRVHTDYFRAGADCGITCSYQATIPGFMECGFSEAESERLIRLSAELFMEARDSWWKGEGEAAGRAYPLCLAGIGPYGAYLADGSEYTGNYSVSPAKLRAFHRRRMELLTEAGADVLLLETQPSLDEALIEADIAEELGADYWISFSCRDGYSTNKGEPVRRCAELLAAGHPHLRMIGVNCTKPEFIVSLIKELKSASSLPVGVYPNGGESYDPVSKTWSPSCPGTDFEEYALAYMEAGAVAVGGCCTTVDRHIRQAARAREKFLSSGRSGH